MKSKKLKKLKKKELIKLIVKIRPKADSYDRICKTLGIENNILNYIKNLYTKQKPPSVDDANTFLIQYFQENDESFYKTLLNIVCVLLTTSPKKLIEK